ncbi:WhiB family transcriptional regulator [Haloechinothrix sp. YIM 98757]|uniref:WhiB family transcriptional regulator n=1 Tax=Haloechinothrix aidingensis TaxID=2752311 RepID=A0A838AF77_9PSEU|nr:WhiB family transcriptional regulator [Haloechinothrix aidingensis]MBA0127912.1 WhiB family transcriptional regulator [Haloechinothrix aidingensis]
MNRDRFDALVFKLAKFRHVPDEVLAEVVTRDGLCFWVFDREEIPELSGDEDADRALAAWLCAGCPVMDECLELELRTGGPSTVGVWGGMADQDRRVLYPIWRWHRDHPPKEGEDEWDGGEPA